MGVLEIIAETRLGDGVLRSNSRLRKSLVKLEDQANRVKMGSQSIAEKKRISAIVELCIEYDRETDQEERKNILRTLEEITANEPVQVPTESLEQFETRLLHDDKEYKEAAGLEVQRANEFLKKYFSLRAKAGLGTQAEVARKSGVHRSYIAVIEKGGHKPQQKTLQKLAKAFGVEITELL